MNVKDDERIKEKVNTVIRTTNENGNVIVVLRTTIINLDEAEGIDDVAKEKATNICRMENDVVRKERIQIISV